MKDFQKLNPFKINKFHFPSKLHYSTGNVSVLPTAIEPGFAGGFQIRVTKINVVQVVAMGRKSGTIYSKYPLNSQYGPEKSNVSMRRN